MIQGFTQRREYQFVGLEGEKAAATIRFYIAKDKIVIKHGHRVTLHTALFLFLDRIIPLEMPTMRGSCRLNTDKPTYAVIFTWNNDISELFRLWGDFAEVQDAA